MNTLPTILNSISFLFLALIFFTAIKNYPQLPNKIPIHFNIEGKADRYSSKKWIFLLPILGLVLLAFMTADLEYNFPIKITKENFENQKLIADIVTSGIGLISMLLFYSIIQLTIHYQDEIKRKKWKIYIWTFGILSIIFPIIMIIIAYIYR
ncbi:MAG: DUF1648 domain-containing protein [Bergeyella zoohelcum]|nr:DUF1648 domain-containing protein [Bergeyella zoohelcum]